jgi:hypothetical protein
VRVPWVGRIEDFTFVEPWGCTLQPYYASN